MEKVKPTQKFNSLCVKVPKVFIYKGKKGKASEKPIPAIKTAMAKTNKFCLQTRNYF